MAWPLLCRARAGKQSSSHGIPNPSPEGQQGLRSALHELGYVEAKSLSIKDSPMATARRCRLSHASWCSGNQTSWLPSVQRTQSRHARHPPPSLS